MISSRKFLSIIFSTPVIHEHRSELSNQDLDDVDDKQRASKMMDKNSPPDSESSSSSSLPSSNPHGHSNIAFDRSSIYGLVKQLADDNRFYFQCLSTSQFKHRFAATCEHLSQDLDVVENMVRSLQPAMLKFDFDSKTPGNGYRSIVAIADSCVVHIIRLLKDIKEQREYVLFRTNHFCKELEAYASVLAALKRDLQCVLNHMDIWKSSEELFAGDGYRVRLDLLMNLVETMDHSCFYGRCMGFQYASSLYRVFQVVGLGLASYSILWEKGAPDSISQTVTNLYQSGRFALNPEERAQRITDVIMNADISFCKSFWNLTEGPFLQDVPKWFCPTLALNEQWNLPAREPLFIESNNGFYVKITQPCAHSGPSPVSMRILSYQKRLGMLNPFKDSLFTRNSIEGAVPKSPNLLFHCHGGGFVAHSSRSHEIYLRHWAKLLDCTVVSIDYSLAPESPYPRAVEEVLYAYAWVLNNADRLGWTGQRICFAGDSAGAHILTSVTLRAIQMTVKRLPDALVLIYSPFLVEYSPSPSRLLSFLDPLLPPGIMARCLAAYIGVTEMVSNKDGCVVKSPLTSSKATLAEYAFNLRNIRRPAIPAAESYPLTPKIPEYEVNLGAYPNHKILTKRQENAVATSGDQIINFVKVHEPKLETPPSPPVKFSLDTIENVDPEIMTSSPTKTKNIFETPRGRSTVVRQRSQSDTVIEFSTQNQKRLRSVEEIDEITAELASPPGESSADLNDDMAVVRIKRDPRRVVVSSGTYDQDFMDYLSQHELTSKSFVRLKPPKAKLTCPNSAGRLSTSSATSLSPSMGRRSRSMSSLSQLGEKLGTVTGFVLDGLSFFMDTPPPPAAIPQPTLNTPPNSPVKAPNRTPLSSSSNENLIMNGNGVHNFSLSPSKFPSSPENLAQYNVGPSRLAHFHNLQVPADPVLSPLRAEDQLLAKMPPVSLIACHLCPLLDDSVTFARRLRRNDVPVTLDVLDSLPHGFLNFTIFSGECRSGAKLCLRRIKDVFGRNS
uniref:Hormone-sensitive lipase n=1 Tax=Romanomermis culicivorax TaxID=13658 RepID=A0A915HQN9_ROMCU